MAYLTVCAPDYSCLEQRAKVQSQKSKTPNNKPYAPLNPTPTLAPTTLLSRDQKNIFAFTDTTPSDTSSMHSTLNSYADSLPIKGNLIYTAQGKSLIDYSFYNNPLFDHIFIYLILSSFLASPNFEHLLLFHSLFHHLYKMMLCINLHPVYSLFAPNPNYSMQTSIPTIRRM